MNMQTLGYIIIAIMLIKFCRTLLLEYRAKAVIRKLEAINRRIERHFRNWSDYSHQAIECFLNGDLQSMRDFVAAGEEEFKEIEALQKEFEQILSS